MLVGNMTAERVTDTDCNIKLERVNLTDSDILTELVMFQAGAIRKERIVGCDSFKFIEWVKRQIVTE